MIGLARALVYLKRMTVAAESIAESQRRVADSVEPRQHMKGSPLGKVSTPSIGALNDRYFNKRDALYQEPAEDEDLDAEVD